MRRADLYAIMPIGIPTFIARGAIFNSFEHVALFDEAQRAWDLRQTASFMRRKKQQPNFDQSEPEFF